MKPSAQPFHRIRTVILVCLAATLASGVPLGCYAAATTSAPRAVYVRTRPSMVWVSPGLWVIEDYDEPVYFTNGFYWYLSGGVWYRSRRWDRDFYRLPDDDVPGEIRTLHHDHYRHFHGDRDAPRFRPDRGEQPPAHPDRDRHEERRHAEHRDDRQGEGRREHSERREHREHREAEHERPRAHREGDHDGHERRPE